jgi:putative ABC transport system permease protein
VRAALGAPRLRLVRQLMVESAVLAAAGGLVGLGIAYAGIRALVSLAPAWIPRVGHSTIDLPTLGITAGLMMLSTAAFGLLPAWHATRVDLAGALSGGSRVFRQSSHRLRRAIVVGELAASLVLLAGAVLMIRTVGSLLAVDPGFDSRGVLAARLEFGGARYNTEERLVAATDALLERVATLPGVEAAALASQVPLDGNFDRYGFHVQGRISTNPELDPSLDRYGVTPGYFRVMRIPLRRGREFARSDAHGGAAVLIVNETAARTLFPGEDPIGKLVRVGPSDSGPWRTIVGVVGDVRHEELSRPASMQFYVPESQFVDSTLTLVVRGAIGASGFESALRLAVRRQAPGVPMYATAPFDEIVRRTVAPRRFIMLILALFAAMATTLAALGLYGVVAALVAERRQEVGVRIALGATSRDIVRLVLGSGLPLVAWGLGLGLVTALALNRSLAAFLFGVTPTDAGTLLIVAVALGVVGIAAHAVPAMRAARVHPSTALREE